MIDSLLDLTVFTRVIDVGSLSAASRELNMSLAVVSKRLARLENRLGVRAARSHWTGGSAIGLSPIDAHAVGEGGSLYAQHGRIASQERVPT